MVLDGQVAVVVGGTGVLGEAMARGLSKEGARVVLVGRSQEKLHRLAADLNGSYYVADASSKVDLDGVASEVERIHGAPNILLSAIGGNQPGATLLPDADFFGLDPDALRQVVDMNLFSGAVLPVLSFGRLMKEGSIITISSVSAELALTRVGGYAAAKAAVASFTQWAAVELGQRSHGRVRVNAIQPGFFLTDQNRSLLTHPDGSQTARGEAIVKHTPMGRFGEPDDLVGTLVGLASNASRFVTGAVIHVDGGFTSWWGV